MGKPTMETKHLETPKGEAPRSVIEEVSYRQAYIANTRETSTMESVARAWRRWKEDFGRLASCPVSDRLACSPTPTVPGMHRGSLLGLSSYRFVCFAWDLAGFASTTRAYVPSVKAAFITGRDLIIMFPLNTRFLITRALCNCFVFYVLFDSDWQGNSIRLRIPWIIVVVQRYQLRVNWTIIMFTIRNFSFLSYNLN